MNLGELGFLWERKLDLFKRVKSGGEREKREKVERRNNENL